MATERQNSGGYNKSAGGPINGKETTGATRVVPASSLQTVQATQASDAALAAQARQQVKDKNTAAARQTIQQINDPGLRIILNQTISAKDGNGAAEPPDPEGQEGIVGIRDPLSMFFMMVFYLSSYSPNITWTTVLKQANLRSKRRPGISNSGNGENVLFNTLDDQLLRATSVSDEKKGTLTPTEEVAALHAKASAEQEQARRDSSLDKKKNPKPPNTEIRDDIEDNTLTWPIQSMPIIAGGISKSVEWSEGKQTTTFAEPLVYSNKGASHIETSIEFEYVVGLGDLNAMTTETGAQSNPWGVHEVMAMTYLALSLVYPYISTNLTGASEKGPDDKPASREQKEGAQFPVIFLRHYSLFPYLTPFVCRGVKIEPDENQPLLFGSPDAQGFQDGFGKRDHHLTMPAVRQKVKITLDLISAHYYLPVFVADGGGNDRQMQVQTSGKSYLGLGQSMLRKRL